MCSLWVAVYTRLRGVRVSGLNGLILVAGLPPEKQGMTVHLLSQSASAASTHGSRMSSPIFIDSGDTLNGARPNCHKVYRDQGGHCWK